VTKILVDASNIVLRNLYSKRNPSRFDTKGRVVTGAVAAFTEVVEMAKREGVRYPTLCFDHGPYLKSADVEEFKKKRSEQKDPEEQVVRKHNIKVFKKLCLLAGFPIFDVKGYEADDLIAMCVDEDGDVIIISNDSDLHQLWEVNKRIEFRVPGKYTTYRDYKKLWPVPVEDLCYYLSVIGTHNGLVGVRGIGPAKAKSIFENNEEWDELYEKHKDTIDTQLKAIFLPYEETYLDVPKSNRDKMNLDKLENVLEELEYLIPEELYTFLECN